jgi:hypothetical protein
MIIVLAPILNFVPFMVSYKKLSFAGNFIFDWAYIEEATTIPRIFSMQGTRFFSKLDKKYYFKKLTSDPFTLIENIFSEFCPFNRARGDFLAHISAKGENCFCLY